ncbi:hypothetical protein LB467_12355 [Salegentibacter sp. JZCK2]|uniref:hypothetical protein n=1 Tax=Salegentibacter tibetensis TaxID=2873600 RepID=UPI001CCCA1F0|nr:hypothetical protein [Salegentibacter tibetensis]MBZ9730478.1 hypothetical protein [Salegentibacter tibetensis]
MVISFFSGKNNEEKFWEWFQKNEQSYYRDVDDITEREKLFDELLKQLHKVHPELTFEFSPLNEKGIRELTISADGMQEFFPNVIKLVESAPKITNWKIKAFRQRIPGDELKIEFDDFSLSYSDIFFKYADEGEKIGVELYIRNYDGSPRAKNAVYQLFDGLLGEFDTETKIGWIDWKKLEDFDSTNFFQFHEMREIVDSKKGDR